MFFFRVGSIVGGLIALFFLHGSVLATTIEGPSLTEIARHIGISGEPKIDFRHTDTSQARDDGTPTRTNGVMSWIYLPVRDEFFQPDAFGSPASPAIRYSLDGAIMGLLWTHGPFSSDARNISTWWLATVSRNGDSIGSIPGATGTGSDRRVEERLSPTLLSFGLGLLGLAFLAYGRPRRRGQLGLTQ
jgi:hypothetical protein